MSDQQQTKPKMLGGSLEDWLKTEAHKNSKYSCGKCGERFPTPDAVYDHLDAEHPKQEKKR